MTVKIAKLFRFLTGRLFITFALILVQAWFGYLVFIQFVGLSDWIPSVLMVLSVLMALYVIHKNEVPAYRLGWVLIILTIPLFGGLMYLFLGDKQPASGIRKKLKIGDDLHNKLLPKNEETAKKFAETAPRTYGTSRYISDSVNFPVWEKTSVKYHSLGEYQFADMLIELEKAEKFIFLEYFIIEEGKMWNTILEILQRKVAAGLDVRVIYDDVGCLGKIHIGYNKKLENLGIKCIAFNRFIPVLSFVANTRDHRKITVIDGNVAFSGGINLADEYINEIQRFGHWKDSGVMLKGAAVWSFTMMFLEMWNSFRPTDTDLNRYRPTPEFVESVETDGFVQPFSDTPLDGENLSVGVYMDILAQSKNYVYIFTPYLAISDELNLALCNTAKRGVDVRIVVPGIPDKIIASRLTRSYYEPLIKAGVEIYEYSPGFIHAKSYICDDEIGVVGTINMDFRSLYLHFECGVFMCGSSMLKQLKQDALETFEMSHRVDLMARRKGPVLAFLDGLFDSVLRLFAPLF